jgi:glucoamylase
MAEAVIHWTDDDWCTTKETLTKDFGIGVFVADIPNENKNRSPISFTFFWKQANHWENENFRVEKEGQ